MLFLLLDFTGDWIGKQNNELGIIRSHMVSFSSSWILINGLVILNGNSEWKF